MNNVLITGVNGYIGSKLAVNLLEKGYQVVGSDLNSSNISHLTNHSGFHFLRMDLTETQTGYDKLKHSNILIHCAALVHKRANDLSRENYFRINFEGTKNILSVLNIKILKQIIFLSTVSVYGQLSQNMTPDETISPSPEDFYGQSKLAAENEIREFSNKYNIPFTILRLTPVYGNNFLLNINKRIYLLKKMFFYKISTGEQRVSLCSVNNIVDVISYSINNKNFLNEIFIIRDYKDYSLNEIISIFREVFLQKYKPVIRIPLFVPNLVFKIMGLVLSQKEKFYRYQLKKITADSIYSGAKIFSSGIPLKWNLKNTLS